MYLANKIYSDSVPGGLVLSGAKNIMCHENSMKFITETQGQEIFNAD